MGVVTPRAVQNRGFYGQKKLLAIRPQSSGEASSIKPRNHQNALAGLNVEPVLRIGHVDEESTNLPVVAQAQAMPENPVRS